MTLRESRDVFGSTGNIRPVSLSSHAVGELRPKAPRTRPHTEATNALDDPRHPRDHRATPVHLRPVIPVTQHVINRGAIRCAGCDTLWKVPPTEVNATQTPIEITRWQDYEPRRTMAQTDKPCPLCGGHEADILRSEINLDYARAWVVGSIPEVR